MTLALLGFDVGVDFSDLHVFEEVVDADITVAGTAGHEGVFGCEFGCHDLALAFDVGFDH